MFPVQISRKLEATFFSTSLLSVFLLGFWRFGFKENFDSLLLSESGVSSENVLEDLQTIVLVVAFMTSVFIAIRLKQARWRLYFIVVSGVLLFVTLEELAFGQHALGLEAPDIIQRVNAQNDITLHNLTVIQDSYVFFGGRFNLLFVLPVVLSLVLSFAWLLTKSQRFARFWPTLPGFASVPLFVFCFLIHVIYALAQSRFNFLFADSQVSNSDWAIRVIDWELGELALYLGLLVWLLTVAMSVKAVSSGVETTRH